MERLSDRGKPADKNSAYWPGGCYALYRSTKPVSKDSEKVGDLFQDYNFAIVHDAIRKDYKGDKSKLLESSLLTPPK
ncbi:unnamed protein product [Sphagnum balticum]